MVYSDDDVLLQTGMRKRHIAGHNLDRQHKFHPTDCLANCEMFSLRNSQASFAIDSQRFSQLNSHVAPFRAAQQLCCCHQMHGSSPLNHVIQ